MKLRQWGVGVAAFVLAMGGLTGGQRSNELLAEEFTYVLQEGQPGFHVEDVAISVDPRLQKHNLGGMWSLDIWQDNGVALIRFDLSSIPPTARVKSAILELLSYSVGFSQTDIRRSWPVHVYECNHEWKEGTGLNTSAIQDGATIRTSDGTQPWPNGQVTASAGELLATTVHRGGKTRWYKWRLKPEIVEEWISGERPNRGLMVWGKRPGKAVSFVSSQSSTVVNRPILRVTIQGPADVVRQYKVRVAADVKAAKRLMVAERYKKFRKREPTNVGLTGEAVRIGDIEWTVVAVQNMGNTLKSSNEFIDDLKTNGKFVWVEVRVENKGKDLRTLVAPPILDGAGRGFVSSSEDTFHVPEDKNLFLLKNLNPNIPFNAVLIYEVPNDSSQISLIVGDLDLFDAGEGAIDLGL